MDNQIVFSPADMITLIKSICYLIAAVAAAAYRCDSSGTASDDGTYGRVTFTLTPGKYGGDSINSLRSTLELTKFLLLFRKAKMHCLRSNKRLKDLKPKFARVNK